MSIHTDTNEYDHALRFSITECDDDVARGRMSIGAEMLNPFGTVHAGALVWFADVVATRFALGATAVGTRGEGFPLALTLNAQLLGNRNSGVLVAEARAVRRGRRVTVVRTEVRDESGKVLLDLTSTHMPA